MLLENSDYEVSVLDSLVTGFDSTIEELAKIRKFQFIKEDLSNWNKVEEIFKKEKFDAVIHFAASLIVPESVEKPLKYYLNNTANTANLVRIANESGVKKFIFSSTAAVYGEPKFDELRIDNGECKINEKFETKPINPYGQSKLFSEKIIQDAAKANPKFKYVIFRYFNVAGAAPDLSIGQKTKNATHLIKVASECAVGKRDGMYIFGTDYPTPDGTCIRDYIHVMDLADAHIKALDYLDENESDVFNIGYGSGASVKEVVDTVKKVSGVDFKVETAPRRAGDPAMLIADSSKIKEKMKWQPKYDDLETICKTAYEWEKRLI
jgi:UDP-glucose 4-epimerase